MDNIKLRKKWHIFIAMGLLVFTLSSCMRLNDSERLAIKTVAIISLINNEVYFIKSSSNFYLSIDYEASYSTPDFIPSNIAHQFSQVFLEDSGMKVVTINYDKQIIEKIKKDKNALASYLKSVNPQPLPDAILILSTAPSSYIFTTYYSKDSDSPYSVYAFKDKKSVVALSGKLSAFYKGTYCFHNTNVSLYLTNSNKLYSEQRSANNSQLNYSKEEFWNKNYNNPTLIWKKQEKEAFINTCSVAITDSIFSMFSLMNIVDKGTIARLINKNKEEEDKKLEEEIEQLKQESNK